MLHVWSCVDCDATVGCRECCGGFDCTCSVVAAAAVPVSVLVWLAHAQWGTAQLRSAPGSRPAAHVDATASCLFLVGIACSAFGVYVDVARFTMLASWECIRWVWA